MSAARELAGLLGEQAVLDGQDPAARRYLSDATESRAVRGRADAVALPATASEVSSVLEWCYAHDVPLIPRGGGSGYAGGAVPVDGGVVLSVERLHGPPRIDAAQWRAEVQAGTTTADLRRRARETGLLFGPDPGAAEQSMIGGNVATNAGGPHSFKYGVTGRSVSGLEVAVAPGELIRVGGTVRKDVAGYDLCALLVGSEGTLGVITRVWLTLVPAPAAALPVVGFYADAASGCATVARVLAEGLVPAALEILDHGAIEAVLEPLIAGAQSLAPSAARNSRFMVIAEADGSVQDAAELRRELRSALSDEATGVYAPTARREVADLWRWRDGVSLAVTARRGGKLSEDIVVPVEHLEKALDCIQEIGGRHGLETCCWGHAGDGNLHATFMLDRGAEEQVRRGEAAAQELFELAVRLGGSVSGEHGIGLVKRDALSRQFEAPVLALHEQIKRCFDPKGLLNPGKKLPR